ncbi:MAG: prepilin-type N-terminal cleavage/methylation domain-containing protein [Planctomycetota bacterium]
MRVRGFTLIELLIAVVLASGIALIVGAATQTATFMGREVAVANAVADMATEVGDELEARYVMSNNESPIDFIGGQNELRPTPHAGLPSKPPGLPESLATYRTRPSLTFRQRVGLTPNELWATDTTAYTGLFGGAGSAVPPAHRDVTLNDPPFPDNRVAQVIDGVRVSARQFINNGFCRFRWLPTPNPRVYDIPGDPGRLTETWIGRDVNGDGATNAESYETGFVVIEFLDPTGAVSTTTYDRIQFGGDGPVRVLWNGEAGTAPTPPLPAIFGLIGNTTAADVYTPVNLATQEAFQLNLLVMHDPIASGGGREVATVFRYQRVIASR